MTIASPPTGFGSLTAVVMANGVSSGSPVQVRNGSVWHLDSHQFQWRLRQLCEPDLTVCPWSFLSAVIKSTSPAASAGHDHAEQHVDNQPQHHSRRSRRDEPRRERKLIGPGFSGQLWRDRQHLESHDQERSRRGGGIKNQGTLVLSNDIFTNNVSTTSGGGVYNTGTLTVSNSTFGNNSATYGGGLSNIGTATLTGCAFTSNSASVTAGGIVNYDGAMTLSNSTLANNTAETGAGIINYGSNAVLSLSNDTIAYNTDSVGNGAGIENYQGTITMLNTIVAGNHLNSSANDVSGTIALANNNVIGTSTGMTITSGTGNHLNVSAGLASSLANNGGPTQTIALQPGSIAMDNGGALTTVATGHPVGVSDTTVFVSSAAAIARTAGSYYILVGQEQMLVTNVNTSTNTMTVQAGVNGTTAASHAVGSSVFFAMDQRGIIRPTPPAIGAFQLEKITSSNVNLPASSISMTINGFAFDPVAANDTVAFSNGVFGVVTGATSTTLTVSITGLGSVAGGTVLFASVTVDGVSSGNAVQVATVTPVITSINPANGPVSGGTSVVITGTNFTSVTAVKFGANNATTFTVNSPTQITATAPPGAGIVDVTITISGGGTSATTSADQFTYPAPWLPASARTTGPASAAPASLSPAPVSPAPRP